MKKNDILDISNDKKAYNGPENIGFILEKLGNPQDKLNIVHVAGTNGKGSTCNFVAKALEENGYRVGLFTSPAIFDKTDRFQINHKNIDEDLLLKYYNHIREIEREYGLSLQEFDMATVIAFLYFYEHKCDFVLLEVGIGGRLDSTNVIKSPLISVIVKIGFDHMDLLGDTLGKIALEKAGIIKENSSLVYYPQEEEVNEVIEKVANSKNTKIIQPDFGKIKDLSITFKSLRFNYLGYDFDLKLQSEIQRYNAVIAFEVIRELIRIGYDIQMDKAIRGINETELPGRYQLLNENPIVIVDGSHNPQAVESLSSTLMRDFPEDKFVFIVGFYKDKDYNKLLELTSKLAICYITCDTGAERSLPSKEAFAEAKKYSNKVYDMKTVKGAIDFALAEFKEETIVIFGSLSLVEMAIKYFK
ncbi:folylpolyglutamate synthase/dihydrofolate synthase family protein [Lagierella sp.]|uniref:bifunctional folylpolyglutamate synthase/dihydrofolate synthase n=1 Tax=Lagierella sp. TaxID=2849657 RepID=UPI002624C5D9|nr:folylpolyglutamate synthase/dihydrofolate synthase family protein [Lagierella sp.]